MLFQSVAILIPLNVSTKEILAHRRKLLWFQRKNYFEPSEDKIALNPDREVIPVERQNNSEGS